MLQLAVLLKYNMLQLAVLLKYNMLQLAVLLKYNILQLAVLLSSAMKTLVKVTNNETCAVSKCIFQASYFVLAGSFFPESRGSSPARIYLLKVNNRNTKTRCEICSKLTIKTVERHQWLLVSFLLTLNIFHTLF